MRATGAGPAPTESRAMRSSIRSPLWPSSAALAVAVAWCASMGAAQAAPTRFSAVDLGTIGGSGSAAYGLNDAGTVVGYGFTAASSGSYQAVAASAGALQALPGLSGAYSEARAINASGQIAGTWYSGTTGEGTAFVYSAGAVQLLGTLGGTDTRATSINASGQVVGHASTETPTVFAHTPYHAFVSTAGTMADLGTLGGLWSFATDINDAGQIVGYAELANRAQNAFIYGPGGMQTLGTLGGTQSLAYGISSTGLVTGGSHVVGDGTLNAFLYQGGAMLDLGRLGGTSAQGYAVNASGWVVGYSDLSVAGPAGIEYAPFLYRDGAMTNLNDWVDLPSDWILLDAYDINDKGQIAATGCSLTLNVCHALLLNPLAEPAAAVPLPATPPLVLAGLALLAAAGSFSRRRARAG